MLACSDLCYRRQYKENHQPCFRRFYYLLYGCSHKNAVSSFNTNVEENQNSAKEISTDDEAYSNAVIKQTEINLETALKNLLLQNNITIKSCDIILSRVENNGIIIASISIYIDKEFVRYTNLVSSIVYDNFGITPNIMTE